MSVNLKSMRKMFTQNKLHSSPSKDHLLIKQQTMMRTNKTVKIISITLLLAVLVLIVLTGALLIYVGNCGVIPQLMTPLTTAPPSMVTTPGRYIRDNITIPVADGPLLCIFRQTWKGRLPQYPLDQMQKPINRIILGHTASQFCNNPKKCAQTVAIIQNYHMNELNQSDINYNFLIGGDGNVYVGRGFDHANSFDYSSLFVAFIGNFVRDVLNNKMIEAFDKLIYVGRDRSELSEDFVIVFHNQLRPTLSPGQNVEKVFKNHAHYSASAINY